MKARSWRAKKIEGCDWLEFACVEELGWELIAATYFGIRSVVRQWRGIYREIRKWEREEDGF